MSDSGDALNGKKMIGKKMKQPIASFPHFLPIIFLPFPDSGDRPWLPAKPERQSFVTF
jgi:hypothetical protein